MNEMKKHLLTTLIAVTLFASFANSINVQQRPRKKSAWKSLVNGFRNLPCRIRHFKAVLDDYNNLLSCVDSCPTGYEERYSLHWGHHCKPIVIPPGCADKYCVRCEPGFFYIYTFPATSRCVKSCPDGHYGENGLCLACLSRGCSICDRPWSCTKCKRGQGLDETSSGRQRCVWFCPSNKRQEYDAMGSSWRCVKVAPEKGTTTLAMSTEVPKTSASTIQLLKSTESETLRIPVGCNDLLCSSCKESFVKFYPPSRGSVCVERCPAGYSVIGGVCVACSDRRCETCESSVAECNKCFPGYSHLLDSTNSTVECVRECPVKYRSVLENGTSICIRRSQPQCPIQECLICTEEHLHSLHHGCSICKPGFYLHRGTFTDTCRRTCPPGFFAEIREGTESGVCNRCATPFCSVCLNETMCTECYMPFVLDGTTGLCGLCPPGGAFDFKAKKCIDSGSNKLEMSDIFVINP